MIFKLIITSAISSVLWLSTAFSANQTDYELHSQNTRKVIKGFCNNHTDYSTCISFANTYIYTNSTISTCQYSEDTTTRNNCLRAIGEIFTSDRYNISPTAEAFCIDHFRATNKANLWDRIHCFQTVGTNNISEQAFRYCKMEAFHALQCAKQFIEYTFSDEQLAFCNLFNVGKIECLNNVKSLKTLKDVLTN